MNVWYFEIVEELDDYNYLMEGLVVDYFGETKMDYQFHQAVDYQFYFVGIEDDLINLKDILDDPDLKPLYEDHDTPYTYKKCTTDVFYNIDKYLEIENEISEIDVLFSFYRNNINKNIVLDKIQALGIDSLTSWDKKVLESRLLSA